MFTFEDLFNPTTTSFFICALVIVVIIAVWLIIRQNNKLIEESVRPYISMTYSAEHNSSGCFVIKNHGKTSAVITRFQYPETIKLTIPEANIYQNIRRMELAPGQIVTLPCCITSTNAENIEFKLIYHSNAVEKNYSETFSFKTAALDNMRISESC